MVNKFIETVNKVDDNVHAIEFLVILKGSSFLSTALIISRNFLMKKHITFIAFYKIKKKFFSLDPNLDNLDEMIFFIFVS